MNYAYFGTPEFSAIILRELIDRGIPPRVLICNPDRPTGRKKIITPPPTKRVVTESGLPIEILQPENKSELALMGGDIFSKSDLGVVAAYGQIIPVEIIGVSKLGIIGVHPSLLPKYRGPSPIRSAILSGEESTGVTLFMMDDLVDHGPIIKKSEYKISRDDTYEILHEKLAKMSPTLLIEAIKKFREGKITPEAQDESAATYTKKIKSEDGYVKYEDLTIAQSGKDKKLAAAIWRKIRALNPEPGVYTLVNNIRTKLLSADLDGERLVLKKIQKAGKNPVNL